MISPWKKIRYRLEWLGVFAMARIMPLLPRKLLLALARSLGAIGYRLDRAGRTTALQNLTAVFGGEKSPEEIERIAKKQAKAIVASELETALGASFFGTKGKVNKFVSDEIDKRFSKGRRDPHFADTVETICKEILKKFHRDMALKYPQMVDRIKIR